MGFVTAISPCWGCQRTFMYNPFRVPSLTIEGARRPFCRDCIERGNVKRKELGLDPIVPLPGAYDSAEEGEEFDEHE